jgi:hypothetical protein
MKTILLFILTCFGSIPLLSQSAVSSAGGNATSFGSGTASYTIGQSSYTIITDVTNGSVAQGVQQSYEISVVTEVEEENDSSPIFSIYPNPSSDMVKLKIENCQIENFRYLLYDIKGNLLQNKKVEGNETSIVISKLESATYFLKVTENNKVLRTFKIIKN